MDPYVYTELQQANDIRLLDLYPGAYNEPLSGTLRPVSLDQDNDFEAISYVWGPDVKDCAIEIEGWRINITSSLNSALKRLRLQDKTRTLWADALCINQTDNEEKSRQVRLMAQIYGKAARVLAYLGDDADGSERAQPLIERMASRILFDKGPEGALARQALKADDLSPVAALVRRPWFQRAWIIQEFVIAKDVQMFFGSSELHWKIFYQAIDNTFSFDELSLVRKESDRDKRALTSSGAIAFSTLDMGRDKSFTSLLELFDLFQDKQATRARDHLFALLSLACDGEDSGFDPDYIESLGSIVRRYAAVFVRRGETFTLLATAGLGPRPSLYPSWIPDWTTKRSTRFSPGVGSSTATYGAAGATELCARYDRDADELIMRGILFDQVDKIITLSHRPLDYLPLNEERDQASYLEKCDAAVQALPSYPTGDSLFDVQWRTLIGDRTEDGSELNEEDRDRMRQSYLSCRENLKVRLPNYADNRIETKDFLTGADGYDFESAAFYGMASHVTMCVTKGGYIGLVPKNAIEGDWISVLHGCPVPFVLRKSTERDGDIFQLVQKVYVHGIMSGELLLDDRVKEQEIRLH
ncbi:HET-domain-containing protein [Hyaloscypha variabilis F]|uniref:HET-domain-containing protein n=1 Tax=Hyaloscypha variabilis (strain UAMH 11265 / GT02V1 / F) TaxID=1149755 RepID=A0A2J6REV3_HYAVF|nr:HET-domain-containing protein [Hyaloscypha variabilis F]